MCPTKKKLTTKNMDWNGHGNGYGHEYGQNRDTDMDTWFLSDNKIGLRPFLSCTVLISV